VLDRCVSWLVYVKEEKLNDSQIRTSSTEGSVVCFRYYYVLIISHQSRYNGKVHPHIPKLQALLAGLKERAIKLPKVIIIELAAKGVAILHEKWESNWMKWDTFVVGGAQSKLGRSTSGEIEWRRQAFDWPLWILFSSGTTGLPKWVLAIFIQDYNLRLVLNRPIVHRSGGMLIQALKEHLICSDLSPADVFFYYTTT
jgi:acetoacetyl-CoA synthetase